MRAVNDEIRNTYATYSYDDLHRLKEESITGLFKNPGGRTIDLSYNGLQPHAVSSVTIGGNSYALAYEENGNLIQEYDFGHGLFPERRIAYTADNMPQSIEYGPSGAANLISFTYDGNGRRVKKQVDTATTYYIDDIYEIRNNGASKHIFAGNFRLAKITGGNTSYFHKDPLGSSMVVSDGNGALTHSIAYEPFGSRRGFLCGTDNQDLVYSFTDQEWDAETGLYNYDARLYDPVIGRFLTADSVIPDWYDPQALDRYTYVRNNPLKYTDPDGHFFTPETIWDFSNALMDAASLAANVYSGNYWGAAADLGALVVDGAATFVPLVPGGAGTALKAYRAGDKVVDGVKGARKGKKLVNASKKGISNADGVIHVTPDKVALPKGPKHKITDNYVENPHGRSGSYGEMVNGKFKEKLRIDPATPPGKKGPNYSHYHKDGKKPHYSPRPGDRDPGF